MFPCGLVVRISGFHPGGRGSIPRTGGYFSILMNVIMKLFEYNAISDPPSLHYRYDNILWARIKLIATSFHVPAYERNSYIRLGRDVGATSFLRPRRMRTSGILSYGSRVGCPLNSPSSSYRVDCSNIVFRSSSICFYLSVAGSGR